jgi:hypothetical protein
MAWRSDFSGASFCVKHFRNPGTGTSAILVYTQVHSLFWCFTQHCAHHGWAANFTDISAGRELALNTLRKVKSVKTTLSNTHFLQITKYIQDLLWVTYSLAANSVAHSSSASSGPALNHSLTASVRKIKELEGTDCVLYLPEPFLYIFPFCLLTPLFLKWKLQKNYSNRKLM